jgi:hypothetical protein
MPDIVAVNECFQLVVDESRSSDEPLEIDDMGLAEYFITVQPDREDDCFRDPVLLDHIADPEEKKKAKSWLEEMIERMVDTRKQQWRTHIFAIMIVGRW